MSHLAARILFWTPRTLTILFAVFLGLFALDVFDEGYSAWQTAIAFFIHLIPAALVLLILLLAWKWEWIGAVLYAAAAVLYAARVLPAHISWALTIALPALVIALLFSTNWIKRREIHTAR